MVPITKGVVKMKTRYHKYYPPQLDVTAPEHEVLILIREDGKTVWINVDGMCMFRASQIPILIIDDRRKKFESKMFGDI